MADKKITEMTTLTQVDAANDYLEIVDASETDLSNKNKKVTPATLISGIRIDQLGEPIDNTNLDVSTTRHGLMKKLSGIAAQFFNGLGNWVQVKDTDLSLQDETTTNATSTRHGFLPKLSGIAAQFFNGLGNWVQVKDTDLSLQDETTTNASVTRHGFLPKLSGDANQYLNGLGQWSTPSGGGGGSGGVNFLFPLRSTIASDNFNLTILQDSSYHHFGILCVNPLNGTMIWIFRTGTAHISNNSLIRMIKSTNGGKTWSTPILLFSENNYDLRNCAGGYTKNGRLIIFYGKYYQATTWQAIAYRYSDDDGLTWSNENFIDTQNTNAYSTYGKLIYDENGTLYQTWYGINTSNNTYNVFLMKSNDNGITWTSYNVYSGTIKTTESSAVYIGGGRFIIVSRVDNGNNFMQFKSDDYGITWTNMGYITSISWTPSTSGQVPMPDLNYIDYNGIGILALYYTLRPSSPQKLNVIYGLAKEVFNNTNGWLSNTIKTIYTYTTNEGRNPGYQIFFHPENKFNGIGITVDEPSNTYSYPVVVFSNIQGLSQLLINLGL
ncbi:sialidase family protein [Rosettibacter firmus]|uniref:sialidase family protein n=1 Tax=Rosettibacter firmus TaxID=3111522 RepID=UPI00336C301D